MKGKAIFPFAFSLFPFVVLATANSAGYRYGASDLAFYGPAVMRHLDPRLFPRDTPLIDAQARLTFMDETIGTLAAVTTGHLPTLFLGLYIVTLVLLALAGWLIGRTLYRSAWTTAALLAALTLRHAIPQSGTNTLEAYFHPRQLAFAFGALGVAAFLRERAWLTFIALAGAALLHPTTTLWLGIWLAIAVFVADRQWRLPLAAAAVGGLVLALWAAHGGPLRGRFGIMDQAWLDAIAEKDYLFPLRWPLTTWAINLAYAPVIWLIYRRRAASGVLLPREAGLVFGGCSLVVVFLVAVCLHAAHVALAVQLQPARVFWMLDFLAIVYAVWAVAETGRAPSVRPIFAAAVLAAVSLARGTYIMRHEFPDRPLFEATVPGDWGRVMAWARNTPRETGWLADPNHAALYGTSVRMAGERDVFVEAVKDVAIGMYDRSIAFRTKQRLLELGDFGTLPVEGLRQIAVKYGLDYLVTDKETALPLAFESGTLRVYRLR